MMQGTSSIVRVASCVVCAGVLAVALMACSGLPATSVEKSVSPAAGKDSTPAAEASADCTGDAEPVTATPGWKIKWSRVFEAPIADPPVVDGSEALIVERADPFVMKLKDTVVSLDLQNGDTRWTFSGANNPGAYSMRQVIDVQASPKYWAIAIRYVMDPHAEEYITVLDRATGQTVYNTDADWLWNIAISDDALYHVDSRLSLRRVDLTTKGVRWEEFWRHSHGSSGLFFVDPWLYEFDVERYVNVQRPISGQLVMTGTLSVTPARWDVLVQR